MQDSFQSMMSDTDADYGICCIVGSCFKEQSGICRLLTSRGTILGSSSGSITLTAQVSCLHHQHACLVSICLLTMCRMLL